MRRAWAVLASLFVLFCTHAVAAQEDMTMGEAWFETRPICFGRYVADVPRILQPGFHSTRLDDFTIVNLGEAGQSELNAKVEKRRALMEAGAEIDRNSLPTKFLYYRRDQGVVILAYERPPIRDYYPPNKKDNIETYFLSGGHLFEIKGRIEKENRDARLESIFRIARATTPRDNEEVPREKGYCIENGFVALPEDVPARISASLQNKQLEKRFTFNVVLFTAGTINEKQYDWPREATGRTVAGLGGIQAVGIVDDDYPGRRGYASEFYAYQEARNAHPSRSINIRSTRISPSPHAPPFSFEAGQRFWDIILDSLRLR